MKRRTFLASAASASFLALAGCSAFDESRPSTPTGTLPEPTDRSPTETPRQYQSYDRVVRLADHGVKPGSEGRVGAVIERELADGTLFVVPDGRHVVDPVRVNGHRGVGVVGGPNGRTTLVPSPAASERGWLFTFENGGDFEFGRFDFDFRGDGVGATVTLIATRGDLYVHDVHAFGVYPYDTSGLGVSVANPDGEGVVERFVTRDGSAYDSPGSGIFVAEDHAGTLGIRDCEVWNWADNGVYASSPGYVGNFKGHATSDRGNGEVHVRGGVFKNNNISNVRIGTTNSSVTGAVIRNERNISGDTWDARKFDIMPRSGTAAEPVVNARGIRLTNRSGQLVEDCDIAMEVGRSDGAIVANGTAGSNTVRNTRVEVTTDEVLYPINLKQPLVDRESFDFALENVTVTGRKAGQNAAARVQGRNGTAFRDCCLSLRGANQDGIAFYNANRCLVSDTTIGVSGRAITTENATVRRRRVKEGGTCSTGE